MAITFTNDVENLREEYLNSVRAQEPTEEVEEKYNAYKIGRAHV